MSIAFLDFGFSELILVGIVALLVFGGNLPEVMRTLGQNYAKLRQTLREFSAPVRDEIQRVHDLPTREGIVSRVMDTKDEPYPGEDEEEGPIITSSPEQAEDGTKTRRSSSRDEPMLDEGPPV